MNTATKDKPRETVIERGMRTLRGDERQPAAEPEIIFRSREEIFNSGLQPYDKARALEAWDREHPPGQTEREKLLASGMSAYDAAQALAKLPPERPAQPRLLPGERSALAEAAESLRALKESYVELLAKREKGQQALEQTSKEKRKLETSLDFDDVPGIQSLIFVTARVTVTQNWLNAAVDKIKAAENHANRIIEAVNQLLTRKFGMTKEPGGRLWANIGMGGALPTRIAGCVAAIETELSRK
jgi:hypothetical protein